MGFQCSWAILLFCWRVVSHHHVLVGTRFGAVFGEEDAVTALCGVCVFCASCACGNHFGSLWLVSEVGFAFLEFSVGNF